MFEYVITTYGKEVMAEVGGSPFGNLSGTCSKMYTKHVTIIQLYCRGADLSLRTSTYSLIDTDRNCQSRCTDSGGADVVVQLL
jgi:hypothetical protein